MRSPVSARRTWSRSSRSQPRTAWFDSAGGTRPSTWSRRPGFGSGPEKIRSGCPSWTSLAGTSRRPATTSSGRGTDQPVVNKELEGWPRVNLAEIAVWDRTPRCRPRPHRWRACGITADQDESLATAYLCAVGLRAEADRADEARVRQRHDERVEAIEVGSELLELIRGVLSRPGPADGWKREVGALAAQCEAEATRLIGEANPTAWLGAVDGWELLSMPYAAAYCRLRLAEALLGSRRVARPGTRSTGDGARDCRDARRRAVIGRHPSPRSSRQDRCRCGSHHGGVRGGASAHAPRA